MAGIRSRFPGEGILMPAGRTEASEIHPSSSEPGFPESRSRRIRSDLSQILEEPALQRLQVHRTRARSRLRTFRQLARQASVAFAVRDSGCRHCRRTSRRSSSRRSDRLTAASIASSVVPASACRSRRDLGGTAGRHHRRRQQFTWFRAACSRLSIPVRCTGAANVRPTRS